MRQQRKQNLRTKQIDLNDLEDPFSPWVVSLFKRCVWYLSWPKTQGKQQVITCFESIFVGGADIRLRLSARRNVYVTLLNVYMHWKITSHAMSRNDITVVDMAMNTRSLHHIYAFYAV
jgi:hypothetical protein